MYMSFFYCSQFQKQQKEVRFCLGMSHNKYNSHTNSLGVLRNFYGCKRTVPLNNLRIPNIWLLISRIYELEHGFTSNTVIQSEKPESCQSPQYKLFYFCSQ